MTKQEVIEKEWILKIGEEKYNQIKEFISDYDGKIQQYRAEWLSEYDGIISYEYDEQAYEYGLKSLQGIESNNGWINPLLSGLPQESCNVYFIENGDEETLSETHFGYWNNKIGYFLSLDNSERYLFDEISHYQPIHKPSAPIY